MNDNLADNEPWVRAALERYEGPLGRYAARIVGGADRAADVVQETFLRLCSAASPPDAERLGAWLFKVCRNIALDVLRKENRMNPWTETLEQTRASPDVNPADRAERREACSAVLRALDDLGANQQEVVRLKFQNGFSYRQIAEITGLSVSNVGFLIHTAIQNLRRRFGLNGQPGVLPQGASR